MVKLSSLGVVPSIGNVATNLVNRSRDALSGLKNLGAAVKGKVGNNFRKMTPDEIGKFLGAGKNWHKTNVKGDYVRQFEKGLRGDKNADFYIDKATNEVVLKGNQNHVYVRTGDKF